MDGCRIRLAQPGDAEALLNIYAPYVLNTAITFEYTVPSVQEFSGRIQNTLARYPYLVALGREKSWAMPMPRPSIPARPMPGRRKPLFIYARTPGAADWAKPCINIWKPSWPARAF